MNRNVPRTINEMWPSKWLAAGDLQKPVTVQIIGVTIEELRQQDGSTEPKLVLSFQNAHKRLICNQTQGKRLAELLGTEVFAEWIGARVKLAPGKAQNGKATIVVLEATKLPAGDTGQREQAPPVRQGEQQPPAGGRQQGQAVSMTEEEAAKFWKQ